MTSSGTFTNTQSFTITHAKHLAAKVATDLKRIQRFHGHPYDTWIDAYENEIIELLKFGYLDKVTYGFEKDGVFIPPTLQYTAKELLQGESDDDPGKIKYNPEAEGYPFCSFLEYSNEYTKLTPEEKHEFEKRLPIKRQEGNLPDFDGYFEPDKTYSSGGKSINRSSLKS